MDEWQQHFFDASPMFEPLRGVGAALAGRDRWPTLEEYNALLNPSFQTGGGAALRFVSQAGKASCMEDKYEARIYRDGEVQTRTENWHDLFNALVWLAFPRTKSALNARHFESISRLAGEGNRGKTLDALTLFDESGVVVLYADDGLANLLQGFHWHELFWECRESVKKHMKFVIFGHSLYEKALKPYIGFTGKGLLLKVDEDFFTLEIEKQLSVIEGLMTDVFAKNEAISTLGFTPVPLLGIPGWWMDNEDITFYANERYFRAAKQQR